MKLPRGCESGLKELILAMMRALKKQYISPRDIEVEVLGEVVKVSIFKWCDAGPGCGNSQTRQQAWEAQQAAFSELFEVVTLPCGTWRWANHYSYYYPADLDLDLEMENYIPGVEYLVLTENWK